MISIYGAGGTGKEVLDIISSMGLADQKNIAFVVDGEDFLPNIGSLVVRGFNELVQNFPRSKIVIAVGEPEIRKLLSEKCNLHGFQFFDSINAASYISPSAVVGKGSIFYPGSIISHDTKIGQNVMIQFNSVIGHDIEIGNNSVISSNVTIGGGGKIGDGVFIGMGSVIKEGISIGNESIIGMGSVVYNDIPDRVIALGNPARVMRNNQDKKVFK
jgi:sugar O-acyltransferase (sialic acid O-acetyltransferase NeuD family)